MSYREIIDKYHELQDKARLIAEEYLYMTQEPAYKHYIMSLVFNKDFFEFSHSSEYGGIYFNSKLPIDLIDHENLKLRLAEIAEEHNRKKKIEKEKNTCKHCGHIKA